MTITRLVLNSLRFYSRTHTGTILGTAISTAILIGALIVGDSVRGSLLDMVTERLGKTTYSLELPHRFFKVSLSQKLAIKLKTNTVPMLKTEGIALVTGENKRASRVQILGIDSDFGKIAQDTAIFASLPDDAVLINETLARQLQLTPGDMILLRLENLDFLPKDTPITRNTDHSFARRYKIHSILNKNQMGNFNLRINQVVSGNIFISQAVLAREMGLDGFANSLLISETEEGHLTAEQIQNAIKEDWKITDAGFSLVKLKNKDVVELQSRSIFMDEYLESSINTAIPENTPILTYFVNSIGKSNWSTPYSFISAPGSPIIPKSMTEDKIIINRWVANDLNVQRGDSLTLTYYIPGSMQNLEERSRKFSVHSVVPLAGIYADLNLMPGFPGLADVDNCRDWDPGIPIDLDKIRAKDQEYWDKYRGMPKAFVTLTAAKSMWQNRFGSLTAIRFSSHSIEQIEEVLSEHIDPTQLGFIFTPIREQSITASIESVDFSQLFIGLSFFIILSALLLTSLLYTFSIEQRIEETGLFLAIGFTRQKVIQILLYEGVILAIIGGLLGSLFAILYTQIILKALMTVWQGAVGTSALQIHLLPGSIFSGFIIGTFIAIITMILKMNRYSKSSVSALQSGKPEFSKVRKTKYKTINWSLAFIGLMATLIIIFSIDPGRGKEAAAVFFIAGFLILISTLAFTNILLMRNRFRSSLSATSLLEIGLRNTTRQRLRSVTLVGALASSLFIVFTVGANRSAESTDYRKRESGTGGFSFFAETVFPVTHNLNSPEGRAYFNLDQDEKDKIHYLQFRLKDGDDASCLNLNRVAVPRLLGVNPVELSNRQAFSFLSRDPDILDKDPWQELENEYKEDVIPGIADETVIIWGLGKTVGDTLIYSDEHGNIFRIKLIAGLANSIFQGNIIISEKNFMRKFPSVSGYHVMLIECATEDMTRFADKLNWAFQDYGLNLVTTARRLAVFARVQNTYLSIFLILGSLGIILGTIGIGIVVMRNVLERVPIIFKSVLFPDPDGPTMATESPAAISRSIFFKIDTSLSPDGAG